jgi:DNA-directed RNA polymerase subunit D
MSTMYRDAVFQGMASNGNTMKFTLTPTHVTYANSLLRLMMTAVEVVGFRADIGENGLTTDVQVEANTTPMTNEMLAHRIGLLPINISNPLDFKMDDYEFSIDVVNDSEELLDVKVSDFKILKTNEDGTKEQVPWNKMFRPDPVTGDTCLIATLKPRHASGKPEELRLKAKASIGVGRENARFIPTSQCSYTYTLDPDEEHINKVKADWLVTSKKIFDWDKYTDEQKVPLDKEFKTLGIQRCYLKNELGEPYSFDFTVESAGVLSPSYILRRACESGYRLCSRFADLGGESLPEDVLVQPTEKRMLGFDFVFSRPANDPFITTWDHTLGNLLTTWIDQNEMNNGEVTFAGYNIPHPLREMLVITIGVQDGKEATARRVIKNAARGCAIIFNGWKEVLSPAPSTPLAPEVSKKKRQIRMPQ